MLFYGYKGWGKKTFGYIFDIGKNIIAQTMIHFLCCFQCSLGHWFMNVKNINIDFNPICVSFEEYFELFIIKVQIYPLEGMTHFTERNPSQ